MCECDPPTGYICPQHDPMIREGILQIQQQLDAKTPVSCEYCGKSYITPALPHHIKTEHPNPPTTTQNAFLSPRKLDKMAKTIVSFAKANGYDFTYDDGLEYCKVLEAVTK